jgi:hypothetical protein
MRANRKPVDHGAAIRVPPAHNAKGREILMTWLGAAGRSMAQGSIEVSTAAGTDVALPGDWIVLSSSGAFFVTRSA